MAPSLRPSRRDFLRAAAVSGGILLGFRLPVVATAQPPAGAPTSGEFAPNAFIRISRSNVITVVVHKAEMGQGITTALPMLIAEELEVDLRRVRVVTAPVDDAYNHPQFGMQFTGGSMSVASEWERLRRAGATAREMLMAAAADTWKVSLASVRAENGRVLGPGGRSLTYGQLVDKARTLPVPQDVPLKDPARFKLIGKPTPRLDSREKVTGAAQFGLDAKVPGMLIALVARPPVFGAKLHHLDAARARGVGGVTRVVEVPSGVAVIADSFWAAKKGRDALQLAWDEGAGAAVDTDVLQAEYARLAQTPGRPVQRHGDAEAAMAGAARRIAAAEYRMPYLAHAPMEPLNCLVALKDGRCDVWTGTQFQSVDRVNAARAAGLSPEQVHIHTLYLGGGFGRRATFSSDFIVEAVHVARAAGAPVKTIWTREDDIRGGFYRPMWHSTVSAGLDASGAPVAWKHTLVGQSILEGSPWAQVMVKDGVDATSVEGAAEIPYAVGSKAVDLHSTKSAVPVLWWRSVGHTHTGFVVESFIDELAHAAGKDPYQYRRALLAGRPRHLGVLDLAARRAGWGTPLAAGRARGIAVHASFGSWCCQVAEVSLQDKAIKVHRVVCAVDCGLAVNPTTIRAQMEGGIVFGVSAALYGQITLKQGRVQQSNFHDYPVLRMDAMPAVEVHIVPSTEPPSGIGEPGTPLMAAALCNALFALTGRRIRSLPLVQHGFESA
ncbi:MAG TPA: xanthine dehydrogenase family protein molybdopterin-binding subunit [Methylomirabilota bacterium]|nr:xanthine dehydrogenase family protein molybdopterin-binding subunit [Methylomirabilota bacterium]